jgi:hypothetical protein
MTTISSTASTISTGIIEAIRAGAEARALLGQCATHALLPDGTHKVQLYDRAAGKLLVGTGVTVSEAVAKIREEPRA